MPCFGKQLRFLRNEAGLSQQSLADRLGTSKSSINMYERDEREPGLIMLETVADYFNVDVEYLLGRQSQRRLLTVHEGKVISAYRNKPLTQPKVDKLLDVIPEKETAPSEDGAGRMVPSAARVKTKPTPDDLAAQGTQLAKRKNELRDL